MAPKKNGFYFLMCEIQRKESEKGVKCTKAAAQKLADPIWKAMTDTEKQRYNSLAKKHNDDLKNDLTKKFSSLGVSFATLENDQRTKNEELNVMITNIKHQVEDLYRTNALKSHMFFVVHVNYYFRTEDNYYSPAEFSMTVFNFEQGCIDTLHFLISLNNIPLGYSYAAKERSQSVHQIPIFDQPDCMMKDYEEIYSMVITFIKKYSPYEMPAFYTMQDDINQNFCNSAVQCFFETMCDAKKVDPSVFRVYHLDKLFYEVVQICRKNATYLSTALMRAEIEKDAFSYAKGIGCFFHEDIDSTLNCSLSMVTRWIFTMCDHCCKDMQIPLRLGYHVPKEVDIKWREKNPSFEQFEDVQPPFRQEDTKLLTFKEDAPSKDSRKTKDYEIGESMRQPKKLYSNKIGANFNNDSKKSLTPPDITSSDNDDDSDWQVAVGRKYGMGRGKVVATQRLGPTLPTSGRGRLAALSQGKD